MSGTKRILVIDDEDMIRDLVKTVLTEAGYEAFDAANGAEGLKIMAAQPIDLVITDILMPEKEGIETIIEIRKSLPDIKIVAVSGGGRAHNLQPLKIAGKIGANATLSKPFEPDELLSVVESVMDDVVDEIRPANSASL